MDKVNLEAKKLFEKEQFAHELGIELLEAGDGYAKLEVAVKPQFANLHGFAHGSLIFSVADSAFALSVNMEGAAAAVQFSMHIFRPVPVGDILIAEALQVYRGRSQAVVDLKVTDNKGRLIAKGQAIALPTHYTEKKQS